MKIRKMLFTALTFQLFAISIAIAQPTPPNGKMWDSVPDLTDDFNDGFKTDKWFKPLWNYPIPNQMKAERSGVNNNGELWIQTKLNNSSNRWFETSRVQSRAQISYPMYTESRIKAAYLSAYNTFWLNNGDINNRNEIDVIENNPRPTCGCQPNFPWLMKSQYFHVVNGDTRRDDADTDKRTLANYPQNRKDLRWDQDYHVFGVWWKDARNIEFYVDGVKTGSVVSERDFTRSLNIIWDLWTGPENFIGGLAVKNHLDNTNINTMLIDWVKTYELKDAPNTGGGNSGNFFIENRATGKLIRPQVDVDNGIVAQAPSNWRGNWTQWQMIDIDGTYFHLKNRQTGKYLRPQTNADNSPLIQSSIANNAQWQTQWEKVNTSNGYFYLRNRWTYKYFRPIGNDDLGGSTGNNFGLQLKPNSFNGAYTQWRFVNVGSKIIANSEIAPSFDFYPTPASDVITVSTTKDYTANILSMGGTIVKSFMVTANTETKVSISNLSPGIYLIECTSNDETFTEKLIIK